jgi:putative endonuclease
MAIHIELGKQGEQMACDWLMAKGFEIVHRNWRHSHYEIDIIAKKNAMLHFIEVKIRNYTKFGQPEDSVTRRKFKHLQRAVDEYLYQHPGNPWIQYGILAITMFRNKEPEFFLLEDVYL